MTSDDTVTGDTNAAGTGDEAANPPATDSRSGLLVVLILFLSTAIDLFFFTGFYSSDDVSYFGYAVNLLRDEHYKVGFSNSRLTLVGWNLLVILAVGWRVQIVAASYIFFHQALNLATFFLARRLFDTRVALLATYSVATLSLMVVFSTCISPDIPIALFSVLSLYAFLRGLDADRAGRRRSAYLWLACAGISVAFGYMAKESALILLPFYFVLWLYDGWRGNKWLLFKRGTMFAAGFFTMLAAEFAVLSYLNQGAYFRLGWVTAEMDEKERAFIGRHGINPIERLQHVDNRLNAFFVPRCGKTFAIVCLAVFPFVRRRRWCLPAMALWTFGYLTFGSIRWGEYLPS
ncbi:MAG: glycosyltransferase family 39 protein, partial [Planctomycetes bacterium]|nr:glycosyltransferase family 39 protein [Planctomycetota bacterium]